MTKKDFRALAKVLGTCAGPFMTSHDFTYLVSEMAHELVTTNPRLAPDLFMAACFSYRRERLTTMGALAAPAS